MKYYACLVVCQILLSLIQTESIDSNTHPSHNLESEHNNSLDFVTSQLPIQEAEPTVPITTPVPNALGQPQTTPHDCTNNVCVRKCCPTGHLLDYDNPGCKNVTLYNRTGWIPDHGVVNHNDLLVVSGFARAPVIEGKDIKCTVHEEHEFSLQEDGKVYLYERREYFDHSLYCIDQVIKNGKFSILGAICYEILTKSKFSKIADHIHIACISISAIFLLAILLLFAISRAKKDLQSKCMIASCASLLLGFVLLLVNNSPTVLTISLEPTNCVALAIAIQFFLLAFYFWLNVMCYEISRVIRGTMKFLSFQEIMKSRRRYYMYCLYAWGSPLLICIVTVIMQYLPEDLPPAVERFIIRPDIAHGRCWFREIGGSIFAYFYGIEIFLHILNASFLAHTSYLLNKEQIFLICCKKESATPTIRSHASKNHLEAFKQRLYIFIFYLLIWFVNAISLIESYSDFWRITDFFVTLQGVFLFFIVIRPKKYALIVEAYVQGTSYFSNLWNTFCIKKDRKFSEASLPSKETEDSVF